MESEGEKYNALLEDRGKIVELFAEKPKLSGVETIDLHGRFIYPGFIDTHTHSFEGGLYSLGVDLGDVKTLEEVFQLLKGSNQISGKIFAFHFDENKITEKHFPTAS